MKSPTIKTESLGRKSTHLRLKQSVAIAAAAAVVLMRSGTAHAASGTWDGLTDATWAGPNWGGASPVPGTGDIATFNNAGNGNTTIDLGGGVTISNVLFDTASAAAYTIGSGAVGSQTISLNNAGSITLNPGVANSQLINSLLSLSSDTNATTTVGNFSTSTLTLAGGISAIPTNGNSLLTVTNTGAVAITGVLTETGAGNLALLKTGAGKLTVSTNAVWSGSGALGRIPATAAGFPLVAREGTLLFNGGSNFVNGELVIGGVVADGGAGQNAKIEVDGSVLNVNSWFSVGRGNGVGGVSSDLVLTNTAVVTAANFSAGFNGSGAANFPKGSILLHNNSSFAITGNGAFQLGESPGADMTMTLSNSAQVIASGTGNHRIGAGGNGTMNINDSASVSFGNQIGYVGYRTGNGVLNINGGSLTNGGTTTEFRVGASDANGTQYNATGTVNVANGTLTVGALAVGRGNNNQNTVSGTVNINSGGTVNVEGDVILGFAGNNNLGKININGGTLNLASTTERWFIVSRWDTSRSEVDMNSGIIRLNANTDLRFATSGNTGSNVFNMNGGTMTFYADNATTLATAGLIDMHQGNGATVINTFNLNGGVVTVSGIISANASGTRIFNFNGGTLRATPTGTGNFMDLGAGTVTANVRNGGAVIDSNGRDITLVQNLQHSDIVGDNATDGGLRKSGTGMLTLAGGSSYTGPTIVNGGGLSLSPSALSYSATALTVSNAALSINVSGGFASLTPTSLTLQNNSTLNIEYGSVTANPSAAALNVSGGLTAPGSGIVINITGFGLKPGTFTVIDYTGAALANLANFTLGPLPPGVVATLVNNTANTSIDLNITSSGQNLSWIGTNANTGLIDNNWDIAVTTNWVENGGSAALRYQEYTTTSTVGDPVRFDDTLFNDFVNPQPTNINLTTALKPFSVTVDSTLPYMFSGAGSLAGQGSVIKSNSGSLFLATSNSYTGGTLVYGGAVVITNENALGGVASKLTLASGELQVAANATNTTRNINVTAASTLTVASNTTYQVGGVINGSGALTKNDFGTLLVTGSNGLTGSLTVNQGVLRNTGNETLSAVVRVGNTSGLDGVLNISAGTFRADNNGGQFASSLIAGAVAGSAGQVVLSGGTLVVQQQFGLGAGQGGYGAFNMSGGTFNSGSYIVVGFNNDRAVYNQTGGTVTINSNIMTIAAGGTGSIGVANISGGTFNSTFGLSGGIQVGERGIGVLNVSGSAVLNVPTNNGISVGPAGVQNGWDGTFNLNGGTVTANRVGKGAGTGVAKANFNGGTLKASTANTTFISGLDSAKVYSGGVILDDGGFAVTVPQALEKPNDYGVSSISLASGGSGYLDAPIVMITGGSGSNATAIATVSGGIVTAVTVTCPGSGYSSSDVLSVTFDNGGAAVSSASANAPVLALNVSGGLVKKGAGTVNLTGANTYSGSNYVSAGTLLISPAHQVTGQPVTVASNAAFGVQVSTAGAATVGNVTFGSSTLDKHSLAFVLNTGSNPTSPVLQCGTLTLNGTNTVRLSGIVSAGTFPLVQYTGAVAGSGSFNSAATVAQGLVATVSNYVAGSTLYVTVTGSPGVVWSGTNSVATSTNVWNLNTITNWLAAGIPAVYQETTPPGDPVLFNDIGSGVVLLSNTASPASVTISNNSKSYAFSGTGKISGTTVVTKQGTGTATLSLAGNDYSGATTINGGTLSLGSGTAIPDGATAGGVAVNSGGVFDLAGFSETINGLSGAGLIYNSSATASTLTIGNGNGGGTWSGTVSNLTGTVTFIKTGTGSLTLTGTNYLGGTSQFNGGTNYLTSTGRLEPVGTGEFWVQQNAGSSTFIVNGGSLSVNNWFVVGRNNAAANGAFILNSGTVTKTGGGNIVIGSLNATGLLEVNGGQILNNSMLWLGENASANATLRLNGGLIQATQIRPNNAVASSIAYFNGGTVQASDSSADFIVTTTPYIQSGGLIFDTQAFVVTNAAALVEDGSSPGGGLTKLGAGTLALTGASSYSGLTTISNGTLQVDGSISGNATVKSGATLGGNGTISGVVTVESGGKLAAGSSIGTLTLNASPVLSGSVVAEIDRNGGTPLADLITVSGLPITYGGTLVITNTGADLQVGDTFTLFNASSYSSSFSIVSQTPNQIVTWDTSQLTVNGTISVATVAPAVNTTPGTLVSSVTGSTLNLSWSPDRLGWTLSSNVVSVVSPSDWHPVAGSSAVTNMSLNIDVTKTNVFFRLVYP
jgi:autotransporter-associated beta strand protein